MDYRVTAGSESEQGSAEPSELPLQSPQQATPSGQRPSQAAQLAAPRQLGGQLDAAPRCRSLASGLASEPLGSERLGPNITLTSRLRY